jgi:hypothetical protein
MTCIGKSVCHLWASPFTVSSKGERVEQGWATETHVQSLAWKEDKQSGSLVGFTGHDNKMEGGH